MAPVATGEEPDEHLVAPDVAHGELGRREVVERVVAGGVEHLGDGADRERQQGDADEHEIAAGAAGEPDAPGRGG
jgi:hypothetical protein